MKIGPKYKIAKRLGAGVFEKTQTPKYAVRAEKRSISLQGVRAKSNYGNQLLEKQKVRFYYGITSKQLKKYVKQVIDSKEKKPEAILYKNLERRLDNAVLRSGLASTRQQARQIVSHGHIKVNGKKINIPSYQVSKDDLITLKESSKDKALFIDYKNQVSQTNIPDWIKVKADENKITIVDDPIFKPSEQPFNLIDVIQFFKR